jgi:hypothetical protein
MARLLVGTQNYEIDGEAFFTPERKFSLRRVGGVLLMTTGRGPISGDEWAAHVQSGVAYLLQYGSPECAIQYSPRFSPSLAQARSVAEAMSAAARRPEARTGRLQVNRLAIVTGSALTRAAVVLIRWKARHTTEIRAFTPGLEREALTWLGERAPLDVERTLALLWTDAIAVGACESRG